MDSPAPTARWPMAIAASLQLAQLAYGQLGLPCRRANVGMGHTSG